MIDNLKYFYNLNSKYNAARNRRNKKQEMDTYIIAGIESEIDTCLVLGGITMQNAIDSFPYRPKYVLKGVGDIIMDDNN